MLNEWWGALINLSGRMRQEHRARTPSLSLAAVQRKIIKLHDSTTKMTAATIRTRLYDYIRIADDKKLQAIYHLLEPQTGNDYEWWNDKQLIAEFDERCAALESGADKGFTLEELEVSIGKLRQEKYRK